MWLSYDFNSLKILNLVCQGLMSGTAELREQAADGLGELIDLTSPEALKPFVVPVTGYTV